MKRYSAFEQNLAGSVGLDRIIGFDELDCAWAAFLPIEMTV